ncbi:MAG: asparaginyl/glutamyl-tRNA amidotransferase subunit C [Alphaproteobacteria bacterium RIFCSPLOWO2_01_FULL_40_26]|nr:MAG: asparaginyl/glutamyl-tRNA amidotransferase subunit C [Alphaproteobacteria bacterium RIFCSPHIGHO2_02_FULL_40_34]OFW85532.1 MAG: asparaginyl/glutamyl-tRNA amidotransferase subunit C [Alphaproteobacteria bacterium RIFCSPHIGHO2_01_FULL_40_8]OFW94665.1 MAG: asparaginyl/glutamyl-tRNA amidotransferase subunit C [Alphaproteobacteria bacterium RIFCSPLOWO2_01_FULL_40_26]OFX10133.1 MAG: asparaginyl/glutamyl-tRNA amidotransferase subunit C [Alphaproteobacteria bacterium RIFCSPLOWO2_02_FULL_40_19]OF
MSQITKEDIKKISRLARIEVPEDRQEFLASQIGNVINWVEQLNEVNTDNVKPFINVHDMSLRLNQDEISDGNISADILKNAKNAKYGYFSVPKVIE